MLCLLSFYLKKLRKQQGEGDNEWSWKEIENEERGVNKTHQKNWLQARRKYSAKKKGEKASFLKKY